jgi:hypothetical protein
VYVVIWFVGGVTHTWTTNDKQAAKDFLIVLRKNQGIYKVFIWDKQRRMMLYLKHNNWMADKNET